MTTFLRGLSSGRRDATLCTVNQHQRLFCSCEASQKHWVTSTGIKKQRWTSWDVLLAFCAFLLILFSQSIPTPNCSTPKHGTRMKDLHLALLVLKTWENSKGDSNDDSGLVVCRLNEVCSIVPTAMDVALEAERCVGNNHSGIWPNTLVWWWSSCERNREDLSMGSCWKRT